MWDEASFYSDLADELGEAKFILDPLWKNTNQGFHVLYNFTEEQRAAKRAYLAEYRKYHKERLAAYQKAYRKRNRAVIKAVDRIRNKRRDDAKRCLSKKQEAGATTTVPVSSKSGD